MRILFFFVGLCIFGARANFEKFWRDVLDRDYEEENDVKQLSLEKHESKESISSASSSSESLEKNRGKWE